MKQLAGFALGLLLAGTGWAGTVAGVTMAETSMAGSEKLVLNGMALRSKAIFKVYVAGLYLPAKSTDAGAVLAADQPRQVVMHWLRNVDKDAICGAWNEGLAANTPNASAETKKAFETLCSYMTPSKTGDRFVFTYMPGEGTTVEVAGAKKGTIAGKEFADALFASWIGPKPGPGPDFRDALMGKG